MSVIKSQRSNSPVEFLHTARQLEIYTIQKAVGFPKRYTFYVSQPLANTATHIHKMVKMGNSVYPQTQQDARLRREYFMRALAELQALVSQIELAGELFPVDPKHMREWGQLIDKETRLLNEEKAKVFAIQGGRLQADTCRHLCGVSVMAFLCKAFRRLAFHPQHGTTFRLALRF